MTTRWSLTQLAGLDANGPASLPVFQAGDCVSPLPGRYIWDQCPVLDVGGAPAVLDGNELWIGLSAPVTPDPVSRHEMARIRLMARRDGRWTDCGDLLPDGFSQGSREWAGMAMLDDAGDITLYYTAAGTAGEATASYRQRIFQANARRVSKQGMPRFGNWQCAGEPIQADDYWYLPANQDVGEPGQIRAFRDPYFFRDPVDGTGYLLFAASAAQATTPNNAAIGLARMRSADDCWELQAPLLLADGISNEMERPHLVHHNGLYYLFWSVHGWTFSDSICAPTGLYGMVADNVLGPYEPLNGSGLVAANPAAQPYQAYSWFVSCDLMVCSFVDMLDGYIDRSPDSPRYPLGTFEGSVAPEWRLRLQGAAATRISDQGE